LYCQSGGIIAKIGVEVNGFGAAVKSTEVEDVSKTRPVLHETGLVSREKGLVSHEMALVSCSLALNYMKQLLYYMK
jgi:hypothetical protein